MGRDFEYCDKSYAKSTGRKGAAEAREVIERDEDGSYWLD